MRLWTQTLPNPRMSCIPYISGKRRNHSNLPASLPEPRRWLQVISESKGGSAGRTAEEIVSLIPVNTGVFQKPDLIAKRREITPQSGRIFELVLNAFFNDFPETKTSFQCADAAQKVLFRLSALLSASRKPEILDEILVALSLTPDEGWRMVLQGHIKTLAETETLELSGAAPKPPDVNSPPLSPAARQQLYSSQRPSLRSFLGGMAAGFVLVSGGVILANKALMLADTLFLIATGGLVAGFFIFRIKCFLSPVRLGGQKQFLVLKGLFNDIDWLDGEYATLVEHETKMAKTSLPPLESSRVKADAVAMGMKVMAIFERANQGELIQKKEIKSLRRECKKLFRQLQFLVGSSGRQLHHWAELQKK